MTGLVGNREFCFPRPLMFPSASPHIEGLGETKLTVSHKATSYCSLVRSNLEYCSVVWRPFTKRNVNKLERIQRTATRFVLKSNEPYDVRLRKLNLLTLEQRRFVDDVTFLFKALNGHLHVDCFQFLDFYSQEDRYLLRHFDTKSLKKKYTRTNILKTATFIGLWMNGTVCLLRSVRHAMLTSLKLVLLNL